MARQEEATLLLKIKSAGEKVLSNTIDSLKKIAQIGAAAFTAIGGALAFSLKQYEQEEAAVNSLNAALVQQGIYTKSLSDEMRKQASELQKITTFGDEQIIQAQALIQSQIGQEKVTKELTKSVLDLAQSQGMSLDAAASLVGKSIGSTTNALTRYGIEIDTSASKSEKLSQVVAGLNSKFGGQAEAAADGLGALKQTGNLLSDLAETIGKAAAPFVLYFNRQFQGLINTLSESPRAFENVVSVITFFAQVIAQVKNGVMLLGAEIGTVFGFIGATINSVTEKGVQGFLDIGTNLDLMWQQLKENTVTAATQLNADLDAIDTLSKTNIETKQDEHLAKMNAKRQKDLLTEKTYNKAKIDADKKAQEEKIANQRSTFSTIATLSQSNNSALAAIGKAAAITQIAIDTPVAIGKALSAFPPPFNFVAAGLVGTAMAAQAARIAGVQLAEGGIVQPRPGGIQATIGEAGQAEAVIPLDRAGEFGLGGGGGATIHFNGPILGDETQARAFAEKIDQELFKLRKSNSSLAFDSGIV